MTKCWFDYKTVIVTGASSGIGKLLAEKLIRDHGCNVIGIARTESKLAALKEELGQFSHKFSYFAFDVSDKDKWTSLAAELEEKGHRIIRGDGYLSEHADQVHHNADDDESLCNCEGTSVHTEYLAKAETPQSAILFKISAEWQADSAWRPCRQSHHR